MYFQDDPRISISSDQSQTDCEVDRQRQCYYSSDLASQTDTFIGFELPAPLFARKTKLCRRKKAIESAQSIAMLCIAGMAKHTGFCMHYSGMHGVLPPYPSMNVYV